MLEPTMLPMARPGLPFSAALAEMNISGADVPKPTMKIPATSGETPIARPRPSAPRTSRSPATAMSSSPPKREMSRMGSGTACSPER